MQIGDRVVSKKIGAVSFGRVLALFDPNFFLSAKKALGLSYKTKEWDENYPEWKEDIVACVKFEQAQRSLTFDEFMDTMNGNDQASYELEQMRENGFTNQQLYELYTPFVTQKLYPIADLEPFE